MLNQDQNKIYTINNKLVSNTVRATKNRTHSWKYGYNEKYNIIVISRDGTIGDIYHISGLNVALPLTPKIKSDLKKENQTWKVKPLPKELKRIQSIFQWHETSETFKTKWVDFIEHEFNYREQGHWFMNKGIPTYITGTHYMYLQWTKIDVGNPDFREANRIFFIFWEACKVDYTKFWYVLFKNKKIWIFFYGFS